MKNNKEVSSANNLALDNSSSAKSIIYIKKIVALVSKLARILS